ncbi:nucleotidyltransferase domain-containing protein [Candidatus Woesearchaeota archaeon]|nr:nucleotidyltransferase domain-containing protein [Candidatus Woesearchaeota archaeon]
MNQILKKIKPTKTEEELLKKKINSFLRVMKGVKSVIGGSVAKGTWLKNNYDVDVFVKFRNNNNLSNRLEKILKARFDNIERIHGSRDYFQVHFMGLNFEVIPILDIKKSSNAKNITDISPLHVLWIKKNINGLEDDVRLAKYFCKIQEVYGAETYIKGFSGYVLEILIIKYGGFINLLKAVKNWNNEKIIGTGNIPKSKYSALIVIDPVQNNRNAAAALSSESFQRFKNAAINYLANFSDEFFIIKKIKMSEIKKNDLVLKVYCLDGKRDVIGVKLLKAYQWLINSLEKEGFVVSQKNWYWNKKKYALMWFNVKNKVLSKYKIKHGPPINKNNECKKFKAKYTSVKTSNERLYVILPRKHRRLKPFVEFLIKNDAYLLTKTKRIKIV